MSAYFNPAISLAMALRNGLRMADVPDLLLSMVTQVVGGILGGLLGLYVTNEVGPIATPACCNGRLCVCVRWLYLIDCSHCVD